MTTDDVEFREGVVPQLRSAQARYPSDPVVAELILELREGSAEFSRLWDRHDVQIPPPLHKTFRATPVGDIIVDCDFLAVTDRDQHLILYTAPIESRDAENHALLSIIGTEPLTSHPDS